MLLSTQLLSFATVFNYCFSKHGGEYANECVNDHVNATDDASRGFGKNTSLCDVGVQQSDFGRTFSEKKNDDEILDGIARK